MDSCSKEYSATAVITKPTEDSFNLTVHFTPMVDTLALHFDSTYTNYWKEPYTVSAFKFYVSKFDLINTDSGRVYHVNTTKYFLVDAADSSTWDVKLLATTFTYNRISFLIGVDSMHNTTVSHTVGPLDSANGMFWNSTSGFIMAKLEGHSPLSSLGDKTMTYQIGGFSGNDNVLRTPTLLFPYGQYLQITAGKKSVLQVEADVNAWFFNPHQVKIETIPSCTAPGQTAKDISENYSKMFSVSAVINN